MQRKQRIKFEVRPAQGAAAQLKNQAVTMCHETGERILDLYRQAHLFDKTFDHSYLADDGTVKSTSF